VVAALPAAALRYWAVALSILLLALPASAAPESPWTGTVVGIADGDSLTILDGRRHQHQVRIAAIDAPERGAPFSRAARDALAAQAQRRQVEVRPVSTDRFGRTVAQIFVDGNDVGLALLEAGLAWHFTRHALADPVQRARYEAAEAMARQDRRGLWAQPDPQPPWEDRAARRAAATAPR
jgi:endonuclease YncB( thermonuclease family)